MKFLKSKVRTEFGVECYMPANGETVTVLSECQIPVDMSLTLLKRTHTEPGERQLIDRPRHLSLCILYCKTRFDKRCQHFLQNPQEISSIPYEKTTPIVRQCL